MKRINAMDSDANGMVDRRVVAKLLVTFFQRGRSPEVLQLMASMLGLSGVRFLVDLLLGTIFLCTK